MIIVIDAGNARVKYFDPRTNQFGDYRHALKRLTDAEWRDAVGRAKRPPTGYFLFNDVPYVAGDAARRHIIADRPKGAARYSRDYYGALIAYALTLALGKSARAVTLFASHAPQDAMYARDLVAAASGQLNVVTSAGEMVFNVVNVITFDEPVGGYSHYSFTETGDEKKKNPLSKVTTLTVDVGGHTTDILAVDPNGEIDYGSAASTRTGVIGLLSNFEKALRTNNARMFQATGELDVRRVEDALLTGVYRFGKVPINCEQEARESINLLVNDVVQIIESAGGSAAYDYMLLTGGGSALVYRTLEKAMPRSEFLLAEPKIELMKYANSFGGAKLANLMKKAGVI